ncbi:MAG: type II toxin-antitoxin system PemK/MazF family toxin [Acidobacteria bacterium]|nr:type II toxin-antitoxin system PemK/MazF family toxin [Acidobacteriota bacterium]
MICDRYDIVVVPFPFSDRVQAKRRPALVLSREDFNRYGHTLMAMVTTGRVPAWPGDIVLTDYTEAGLMVPCVVRMKFFTLDNRLILRKIGRLGDNDAERVSGSVRQLLGEADECPKN